MHGRYGVTTSSLDRGPGYGMFPSVEISWKFRCRAMGRSRPRQALPPSPIHVSAPPHNAPICRGYVWEPDRNEDEDKEFITFIAEVEGLSAVPDGRIFMNAFIDKIEGEQRFHVQSY